MEKENKNPLQNIFNQSFEETYKDLCLDFKSSLFEPNGKKLSVKLGQFKSDLFEKVQLLSAKRISSNGLMPDAYTEYLFQEYKYYIADYEEPIIDYFISEQLATIKHKFQGKELAIPENIQLDEVQTVELIAKWQTAKHLLEKLHQVNDTMTPDEILEFVSYGNLINKSEVSDFQDSEMPISAGDTDQIKRFKKDFTLMRQMIAFKYLIKHFEHKSAGTDITKLAEFARFLTGRELGAASIKNTNIYKFLNLPFRKLNSSQIRDYEFVINYFQDLGMNKIVNEMKSEIENTKKKSENIG